MVTWATDGNGWLHGRWMGNALHPIHHARWPTDMQHLQADMQHLQGQSPGRDSFGFFQAIAGACRAVTVAKAARPPPSPHGLSPHGRTRARETCRKLQAVARVGRRRAPLRDAQRGRREVTKTPLLPDSIGGVCCCYCVAVRKTINRR